MKMGIDGEDSPGVMDCITFLRNVNLGKEVKVGERVAVIGGGNAAVDTARVSLRLGAKKVTIIYRRTRAEMPANPEEVEATLHEGIEIIFLAAPSRISAQDGELKLENVRMKLGEPDASGRCRPEPIKGSEYMTPFDTIIAAIGQRPVIPEGLGVTAGGGNTIPVDSLTLATDETGVFAGGDAVTGPKSAVEAISQGHEAAISIARYLNGDDLRQGREQAREEPAPLPEGKHEERKRVPLKEIPLDRRVSSFDEVVLGYTEEEALAEAGRCLDCSLCSECLQCVAVCQAKAIDHTMQERSVDIPVGSVILAPGLDPFDATIKGEYGYGRMANVVTSLDFERILSASGPFQGQVVRPSDGEHPKKVAWIQCVGSRDETCGRDYCSSVCCMYATKEAIIAIEHDSNIAATIFYNDIRAFGKGFERYYQSAIKNPGIRYVKSIVSTVKEMPQSQNLVFEYVGENGQKIEDEFDMVVLSVGIGPSASAAKMAENIGIETDRFGFAKTDAFQPNLSSRSGVYVAGAFETPMDIPESVMSASAAACLASQEIAGARNTMVTEKVYPPEIEVDGDEPRVGVFVCRCGANIARVIEVPAVTEYARTLPHVVYAEENLYTCSTDTQNKIIEAIKEHGLNRVVVASCSPRTHEALFQDTIREAGLNRFLFEMANIRDQCSWVHASTVNEANEKAKDLVRMAIARAVTLKPLQKLPQDIKRRALVIGGGLSGMTAALSLAAQGFESVLLEREKELGGNLRRKYHDTGGADPQALLESLVRQVTSEPLITVYQGAGIKDFSGYVGNYQTEITTDDGSTRQIEHGVVIVATGGVEYQPTEYLYGQSERVLTQLELEAKLASGEETVKQLDSVVMIQCVGSREEDHMYCSRICCTHAVKNAIKLKQERPETEVYILYRDMRTYGLQELQYKEARNSGVIFIRYDEEKKPEVSEEDGHLVVRVFDPVLDANIELKPDLLALSSAVRPQPDTEELASRLKLPLTQDKFYMEAHLKLRPLDFISEGMYLCGLAHSPKSIPESIVQARGAVSRALTVLSQPYLMVGGIVSVVDADKCVACLTCVRSCPFGVPQINEDGVAHIEVAACQGCGICAAACPRKAITLQHYTDLQVTAKSAVLNTV
jgi:heterodisulfide reductase subunit A-like polyferredoxin